jgi:outer membrane protein assembly factor BamA
MEMLIQKPFEKEAELSELKKELATLEREILQTIKAKAMGAEEHYQDQGFENTQKQAPVIKLDDFGNPALLQKKVSAGRTKGLHM